MNRWECVYHVEAIRVRKTEGSELQAKTFFRDPAICTFVGTYQIHPAAWLEIAVQDSERDPGTNDRTWLDTQ